MPKISEQLIQVGITELPTIISWIKEAFIARHPDQPEPTSAEVLAAYQDLFTRDVAIDEAFLAETAIERKPPEQD